jgi:phosphoglycerol transferase
MVYEDGTNPILNAVVCSDHLISGFVQRILSSPYADNTTVVVASDHISLNNSAIDQLMLGERRDLFMILDQDVSAPSKINVGGSPLDIGSTLLPYIGFRGEIGLGRDLNRQDADLESEIKNIHANREHWIEPLSHFWDFPRVGESLNVDILNGYLEIDKRHFGVPALIEFGPELQTTLRFQFDANGSSETLSDHVVAMDTDTPFLWIDSCRKINHFFAGAGKEGVCVAIGAGKLNANTFVVENRLEVSRKDLERQLFN